MNQRFFCEMTEQRPFRHFPALTAPNSRMGQGLGQASLSALRCRRERKSATNLNHRKSPEILVKLVNSEERIRKKEIPDAFASGIYGCGGRI